MYHAKRPRKKRLRVRIERCWYVTIEDETETDLDNDFVFGTREDAEKRGGEMLKIMEKRIADAAKASVEFCNAHICGKAVALGGDMVAGKTYTAFDELQKEMEKKCSPEF